jgi:hypothetical protein
MKCFHGRLHETVPLVSPHSQVHAAEHHFQAALGQRFFQPLFGDRCRLPFLCTGVRLRRVDAGNTLPRNRIFRPSHFTVSPSPTVKDAQMSRQLSLNDISTLGRLQLPPECLFLLV